MDASKTSGTSPTTVVLYAHPTIEGLFLTNDGRFLKLLPASAGHGGYSYLHVNGTKFATRRHTLVAEIHKGPRPFLGAVVRHLDGTPSNDAPDNLEWGTQQENIEDAQDHGTIASGEKNAWAKLTWKNVREIRERIKAGATNVSLAKEFNVTQSTICDIRKGRTWKREAIHLSSDQRTEVLARIGVGESPTAIANDFGVSTGVVRNTYR